LPGKRFFLQESYCCAHMRVHWFFKIQSDDVFLRAAVIGKTGKTKYCSRSLKSRSGLRAVALKCVAKVTRFYEKNMTAAVVVPCWRGGLACSTFMVAALFMVKGEVINDKVNGVAKSFSSVYG